MAVSVEGATRRGGEVGSAGCSPHTLPQLLQDLAVVQTQQHRPESMRGERARCGGGMGSAGCSPHALPQLLQDLAVVQTPTMQACA